MADRQPRRWTLAEDQILREQVEAQQAQGVSRDWCQAALALPGRTNKDCRKRWHNSIAEGLRKGQWSKSEDQLLTHGVHRYGSQWTKVATCVDTRSADQCAKRWQQSLDPRLDRSEWREHEDADLLTAVERLGRHWKDIQAQYLPHRSKNCVKNRYSVLARRNAAHSIQYDESVEGSSSDPGTPLQLEGDASFGFALALPFYDTTQVSYEHTQYSEGDDNSVTPIWSGFGDSHGFLATEYSEANHTTISIPAHPTWNHLQTTMSMQEPMQSSAALATSYYTHTYQSLPQFSAPVNGLYSTSLAQATNPYAPVVQPLTQPQQRGRHRQPRKDSTSYS